MNFKAYNLNPTILREYDIRGIVGGELSLRDAYAIGRAFGTQLVNKGLKTVCVGYDGRLSSKEIESKVVDGLNDSGIDVYRIGLGPTPMLYFAVNFLDAGGGIMVSGSHNPPDYNGFKFMLGSKPYFGKDIQKLGHICAAGKFSTGAGENYRKKVLDQYISRIFADYRPGRNLRVAWDAGNGSAGEAMVLLTAILPGEHILINENIDGNFPSHHPDPSVEENLFQLKEIVIDQKCDLGIAFDGDGDRIGVIDGDGNTLWGDQLLVVWAEDVLAENPGATIIADVKASQMLFDQIEVMGGIPLMWKTGHSLIKAKMEETGALLSGEMSGHIFFADKYYGYDDALYAAVRLLSSLSAREERLSEIRKRLPNLINTPELRLDCPEDRKFEVVNEVRFRLQRIGANFSDIDGVRVLTDDGWWLLRASNTQNALVARCESSNETGLKKLKKALAAQLSASGIHSSEI